ncbi:MAG: DUF4834 family protein [Prevotella sp.]|nr:DUF4834 family protein [Candidatus Equicola faecalis]
MIWGLLSGIIRFFSGGNRKGSINNPDKKQQRKKKKIFHRNDGEYVDFEEL